MNQSVMLSQNVRSKKPYFPALFIVAFLLRPIYMRLSSNFSVILGFDTKPLTYLYYGILWVLLVASLSQAQKKIQIRYFSFVFIATILILLDNSFRGNVNTYIFGSFFSNLPIFASTALASSFLFIFIGGMTGDYEKLRSYLHFGSRIGLIGVIIADFQSLFVIFSKASDDMAYSYGICIFVCDLIFEFLEKKSKTDLVLMIIGIISIFISGTRGPLLCIAAIFLLWTFLYQKKGYVRIIAIIICAFGAVMVYAGWIYRFLEWVDSVFQSVGIKNLRIFEFIYSNNLTDSSGRDNIYALTWENIMKRPFLGHGIGGDRLINDDSYAHNIILEIFSHFGILIGLIILGILFYYLIRSMFYNNKNLAAVCTILFASIVVKLFLSSSYILSQELFLMLGLILNSPGNSQSVLAPEFAVESGGRTE